MDRTTTELSHSEKKTHAQLWNGNGSKKGLRDVAMTTLPTQFMMEVCFQVPSDNAPDQCVNFRALIISKCQNQFMTDKVDENVLKLEKELAECTDPVSALFLMINHKLLILIGYYFYNY